MRRLLASILLASSPVCSCGEPPVARPVSTGPSDSSLATVDAPGSDLTSPDAGEPWDRDSEPWDGAQADARDGSGFALPDLSAGPSAVSWCALQHPPSLSAAPGRGAGVVYGRVHVPGFTDVPRDSLPDLSSLEGELGWAPENGAANEDRWTWTSGLNARAVDANHEFEAVLASPSSEGLFRYAWRFRTSQGAPWTLCDLDGSDDGFDPLDAGQLTVAAPRTGWCRVQHPTDELLMTAGETTERLYGRVFAEGLTGDARRGAVTDVESQVGYGPRGSTPDADWTWVAGAFNVAVDNGLDGTRSNDEHVATLTVPNPGTYVWTWRFRVAPDGPWRVCDLAGADPADPAALPRLTVVSAPR
jgi:hypothetical protein